MRVKYVNPKCKPNTDLHAFVIKFIKHFLLVCNLASHLSGVMKLQAVLLFQLKQFGYLEAARTVLHKLEHPKVPALGSFLVARLRRLVPARRSELLQSACMICLHHTFSQAKGLSCLPKLHGRWIEGWRGNVSCFSYA